MKIDRIDRTPNGFNVRIEIPDAYTDGTSRYEEVSISAQEARGKTQDQLRELVRQHVEDDSSAMATLGGINLATPVPDRKDALELNMRRQYEEWQQWKNTRLEAQARALGAAVISALTTRENKEWTDYVTAIQRWRAAT